LKTGRYHQHLKDYLDLDDSALKYMMKCYPEEKKEEQVRKIWTNWETTGINKIFESL